MLPIIANSSQQIWSNYPTTLCVCKQSCYVSPTLVGCSLPEFPRAEANSRNFQQHNHRSDRCDVIVCWNHNWPECPKELEVIELKRIREGRDRLLLLCPY